MSKGSRILDRCIYWFRMVSVGNAPNNFHPKSRLPGNPDHEVKSLSELPVIIGVH